MKDKIIKLILESDKKLIGEGWVFYASLLADDIVNLLKNVRPVCDCEVAGP